MAHPARQIANEFIRHGYEADKPLTMLQIIKLVYFAHGWMLAYFDRPLVTEKFKAWTHGPVIPDLFHALKHYEGQPVTKPLPLLRLARHIGGNQFAVEELQIQELDPDEQWTIDATYRTHGHFDGPHLVNATHRAGGAWDLARKRRGRTPPLLDSEIRREFYGRLNE